MTFARAPHSKGTVYVVDDEATVRKALRMMLQAAGYEVETFGGAKEFLESYDSERPGCLLLDVRMPEMDGLELQRHLAQQGSAIPIVFLSAHGDIPMAVGAVQRGAMHFLEKPADPAALREQVAAAVAEDRERRRRSAAVAEIRAALESLTDREMEILEMLADGKSAKTIAHALGIAHSTVRVLRARLMKKMRADTAADLVKLVAAVRNA